MNAAKPAIAPLVKVTGTTIHASTLHETLECGHLFMVCRYGPGGFKKAKRRRCDDCQHGRPTLAEQEKLDAERYRKERAAELERREKHKRIKAIRKELLELARQTIGYDETQAGFNGLEFAKLILELEELGG